MGALNSQAVLLGNANIALGFNNQFTNTNNTTAIGNGFATGISNIFLLGNAGQNILVGAPAVGAADAGYKLQIAGDIATNDPDTGIIDVGWLLGKVVAGAVALDATRYVSVKIGGVAVKLLVAA